MKKYELLPEHKAQLEKHTQKWIDNGLSTKPMDEHDKSEMIKAVQGMYKAANLKPPPVERIVFVPSPMVARFAGGFAASIWAKRKNILADAARNLTTDRATSIATSIATGIAKDIATEETTNKATSIATCIATEEATTHDSSLAISLDTNANTRVMTVRAITDIATNQATDQATDQATEEATNQATEEAIEEATRKVASLAANRAANRATKAATNRATWYATNQATEEATIAATLNTTLIATDIATNGATDIATNQAAWLATKAATEEATEEATNRAANRATKAATNRATDQATNLATDIATEEATNRAAYEATNQATEKVEKKDKWYGDISGFIKAGIDLNVGKFGFECAALSWKMYQGGNFWSGKCAFLSFFKDVVKLDIDYSAYEHWEKACIHGSFRIMHPEFCMISDRPLWIKTDNENLPHSENGPYIKWSDGTGFYAWHGVYVPQSWIENPETLTPEMAISWENVEQRRVAGDIIGWDKIISDERLKPKLIDEDDDPHIGELWEVDLPDIGKSWFVKVKCGTGRTFALCVEEKFNTALEANASLGGWQPNMDADPNTFIPFIRS